MQRNRRRLFPIVYRSHQYRFMAMILIYNSVIVAFLVITIFVPDIIQMLDESLSFEVRAAAAEKILVSHSRVWPALMALICIIGLHSFRFFHRFIGPLYRFRLTFERMRDGDLSFRTKIRKNDFLHKEEQVINEMIEVLAGKIKSMQLACNDSLKSLNELTEIVTGVSNNGAKSKELLLTHRQHLDTLADAAQYFRVQMSEKKPLGSGT